MANFGVWLDDHWNWRTSGHWRLASLLSAWGLVFAAGVSPWVLVPLAGLRFAASIVQSLLNIRLGRVLPVARTDRLDWVMIGSIFVAGEVLAALHQYNGVAFTPLALAPLLVPFSLLQLRMCWRSYRAVVPPTLTTATVTRLYQFTRTQSKAA